MKKLLIVDNSLVIPDILTDFLSKNNYFKIFKAKTFEDVKQLVTKHQFFASISNVVLPDALKWRVIKFFR